MKKCRGCHGNHFQIWTLEFFWIKALSHRKSEISSCSESILLILFWLGKMHGDIFLAVDCSRQFFFSAEQSGNDWNLHRLVFIRTSVSYFFFPLVSSSPYLSSHCFNQLCKPHRCVPTPLSYALGFLGTLSLTLECTRPDTPVHILGISA